jgi:hypothetical protein
MFIPLAAKYHTPAKFGECVARHNAFLNDHRNIAIVGLAPDAMDSPNATEKAIWASIRELPGVYRCDPCRRTSDLGKWNISCSLAHHPAICAWIDHHLVALWESIPNKDNIAKIDTFPTPERLSKGRRITSASSIASGLTDTSPIADYFRKLESNLPLKNLPTTTTFRNAWNHTLPVDDIVYSFNTTDFPTLPYSEKPTKSHRYHCPRNQFDGTRSRYYPERDHRKYGLTYDSIWYYSVREPSQAR